MTEDYRPTSSADGRAESMADQILLIPSSSDPANSYNNNALQYGTTAINMPESSPTVRRIFEQSNQPVRRSSLNTSNKLFRLSQIKNLDFYRALLSEFIGTMLLTIVCTSTGLPITSKPVPDLNGSLASGLVVATIIVGFGHISGAHINPAVTITFLTVAEIDCLRAFCYICVQLLGAISGSSLVRSITPLHAQGNLGMTMITDGVSLTQAFVVEFLITFMLCYTVHSICDKRRDDVGGSKALAAGFVVTVGCLFGGPYTGASMNPARSFGPAVVMSSWQNHWIYWLGPLTGSITAALVYTHILKKPAPTVVHS